MRPLFLFATLALGETPVYKPNPAVKVVHATDYDRRLSASGSQPMNTAGATGVLLGRESRTLTKGKIGSDGKIKVSCEPLKETGHEK